MVRGKEGRTGLHAIALNGPSVISTTSSSPRGSPLSNAASTKELASYDSASTSALADARLRSPFIVSSGICLLGTTRRCVPPRSVAPSTTSRCSQPSTSNTTPSTSSSVLSSRRTCTTIGCFVEHRCGRIHERSSVFSFFSGCGAAPGAALAEGLKLRWQAWKRASCLARTVARTAS